MNSEMRESPFPNFWHQRKLLLNFQTSLCTIVGPQHSEFGLLPKIFQFLPQSWGLNYCLMGLELILGQTLKPQRQNLKPKRQKIKPPWIEILKIIRAYLPKWHFCVHQEYESYICGKSLKWRQLIGTVYNPFKNRMEFINPV